MPVPPVAVLAEPLQQRLLDFGLAPAAADDLGT